MQFCVFPCETKPLRQRRKSVVSDRSCVINLLTGLIVSTFLPCFALGRVSKSSSHMLSKSMVVPDVVDLYPSTVTSIPGNSRGSISGFIRSHGTILPSLNQKCRKKSKIHNILVNMKTASSIPIVSDGKRQYIDKGQDKDSGIWTINNYVCENVLAMHPAVDIQHWHYQQKVTLQMQT